MLLADKKKDPPNLSEGHAFKKRCHEVILLNNPYPLYGFKIYQLFGHLYVTDKVSAEFAFGSSRDKLHI